MGMRRGFLRVGAEAAFAFARRASMLLASLVFLAGNGPAGAADLTAPPEAEPNAYTYFNVEGGYIHFDGEPVQAYLVGSGIDFEDPNLLHERSLDTSEGYYGRVELGHMWGTGFFNGIGGYVQGWDADKEDVSETDLEVGTPYKGKSGFVTNITGASCTVNELCAFGKAQLDRSLIEFGMRAFHDFGEPASLDHVSLGIEPFVAIIDEHTKSRSGFTFEGLFSDNGDRSSDLDAKAFGALVALDLSQSILEHTVLIARIAGGPYHVDADAKTSDLFAQSTFFSDEISSDFWGLRGQAALGLEQMLTDSIGVGVIGRLDYWSDYPTMDWPDFGNPNGVGAKFNAIASEDLLTLSIGARISVTFR